VAETWLGDEGCIYVAFDERGRVQGRNFSPALHNYPPSLAERVRAWLRRLWP
jgi:hypothetical protein